MEKYSNIKFREKSLFSVPSCPMRTDRKEYLLTPCIRALFEKLTGLQLVKKFPTFYGTRRFITAFISTRQMSLSWASSIQSITPTSHFLKINLNIILLSTPGSPQWSLSLRFPHQNPVNAPSLLHTHYMPRPSHSSRFYHPDRQTHVIS
jgi:hypothetical protein